MLNIARVGVKKLIDSHSLMLSVYERECYIIHCANLLSDCWPRFVVRSGCVSQSVSFHLRGIS